MKPIAKKTFSLLEISIGLALTTILVSTLFSSFRQLLSVGAIMEKVRHDLHPFFIFQLRCTQIFEKILPHSFFTASHVEAKEKALYFIFQNGADIDPYYCGEVEGALFLNKEGEVLLKIKNERVETLFTNIDSFHMQFFDPKEKRWIAEWKKDCLPPLITLEIQGKKYSFFLPKAMEEIPYK